MKLNHGFSVEIIGSLGTMNHQLRHHTSVMFGFKSKCIPRARQVSIYERKALVSTNGPMHWAIMQQLYASDQLKPTLIVDW